MKRRRRLSTGDASSPSLLRETAAVTEGKKIPPICIFLSVLSYCMSRREQKARNRNSLQSTSLPSRLDVSPTKSEEIFHALLLRDVRKTPTSSLLSFFLKKRERAEARKTSASGSLLDFLLLFCIGRAPTFFLSLSW